MVGSASDPSWIFDIFSWEHLASAVTVFALLISTAFIPIWHMFRKRSEKKVIEADEKETQKIKKISQEILNPLITKLNEHDEVVKDVQRAQKTNDKISYDTLSVLRALTSEFHQYKDQQHKINAKLYFLDGVYRNNVNAISRPENNRGYRDWRTINYGPPEEEDIYRDEDNNRGVEDENYHKADSP